MVLSLHIILFLAPSLLPLVLPLLLVLKVLLKLVNLIDQTFFISFLGLSVLFDIDTDLNDMLLQFDSLYLGITEVVPRVLHISEMVVNDGALVVQGGDRGLEPLDLDLLLRDLHRHLVLLVVQHVLVVSGGHGCC